MKKITGILLVNLGTPDSPKTRDVYRYLIEFLTDDRVLESPWLIRQFLVRGIIVPSRYRQSSKSYHDIWTSKGSPLKAYGYQIQETLQERLGRNYVIELGMRYQNPSIETALKRLQQAAVDKLVILPLFPQYASATTGSIHQKVMEVISKWNIIPELQFVNHYSTHPRLIEAFCAVASPYPISNYDHVLLSFHGLPQSQLLKGDSCGQCLSKDSCCSAVTEANKNCYSAQCYATARALIEKLNLDASQFSISFQSRLGKEPWLQPYTNEVITNLAKRGKRRLLVFCPSFVCDCLETIYEIGIEYAKEFKHAGGEKLDLVPGLNDHPAWIEALMDFIKERE